MKEKTFWAGMKPFDELSDKAKDSYYNSDYRITVEETEDDTIYRIYIGSVDKHNLVFEFDDFYDVNEFFENERGEE